MWRISKNGGHQTFPKTLHHNVRSTQNYI
jgi:hypothetical protein